LRSLREQVVDLIFRETIEDEKQVSGFFNSGAVVRLKNEVSEAFDRRGLKETPEREIDIEGGPDSGDDLSSE